MSAARAARTQGRRLHVERAWAGERDVPAADACALEQATLAAADTASGREAYGKLVQQYAPALLRHLRRLLHNQAEAQDVAQETFLRAWLALRRCPPDRNVSAWLKTVATRCAYNYVRGERHRRGFRGRTTADHEIDDSGESRGRHEYVQRLLEGLTPAECEILTLRYVEEFRIEEIARYLGIGTSATKMRLHRARKALCSRHEQQTPGPERIRGPRSTARGFP